ncbi:unnamed protein product [Brassica rapa subsp. trilocularis]
MFLCIPHPTTSISIRITILTHTFLWESKKRSKRRDLYQTGDAHY